MDDQPYTNQDAMTRGEARVMILMVMCITLMFMWWTRTLPWAVLASGVVGGSISIGLYVYWFLMEEDKRDEEEYYGWTEDDQ